MKLWGRAKPKSSRRRRQRRTPGALPWVLGLVCVVLVVGVGALKWARTRPGQAALLGLGSQKAYQQVQEALDEALTGVLPGYRPGPLDPIQAAAGDAAQDLDWPAPQLAPGAAVRCRQVAVTADRSWWDLQRDVGRALAPVGGRVLWAERLFVPTRSGRPPQPDETNDLLRLDVGVPGRPTHTLVLVRQGRSPRLHWGTGPGTSDWQLLAGSDAPTVALVLDDWGYGRTAATAILLDLEVPLTLAVLPGLSYSRNVALEGTALVLPPDRPLAAGVRREGDPAGREARLAAGCFVEVALAGRHRRLEPARREILLHFPMEPQGYPETDPGPRALLVGMPRERIAGLLDEALTALPTVSGVNNHMGSAATADAGTMADLMGLLRERDLFFLDSLTTSRSVAYAEARRAGVPALRNRIFLDYDNENETKIAANLQTLVRSAQSAGFAVGIGHPHAATAAVLARELPRLQAAGIRFVTVSELLALQEERAGS